MPEAQSNSHTEKSHTSSLQMPIIMSPKIYSYYIFKIQRKQEMHNKLWCTEQKTPLQTVMMLHPVSFATNKYIAAKLKEKKKPASFDQSSMHFNKALLKYKLMIA